MDKPPLSLCYPSYVIEYAIIDDTIEYKHRNNLNVGGKWVSAVPKLAICKDTESGEYYLAHCNKDWELECYVECHKSIEESKENAEKHYQGINGKWVETNYNEADALQLFEEEKESMRCSFCGKSHYDEVFSSIVTGENANICNLCIESFYIGLKE